MLKTAHTASETGVKSPFARANTDMYSRWRDWKLEGYPTSAEDLIVEISNPLKPAPAEIDKIRRLCSKTNMAIYATREGRAPGKEILRELGRACGLHSLDSNLLADDDGVSSLRVMPGKARRGYIPYSSQRLLWHTDGYYNPPERRIRAFALYCESPAARGGGNALLDHEMIYIHLRDNDEELLHALMAPDAMTIPPNLENGATIRPASTGPVFQIDPVGGNLHMRYTARTRSIEWRQDEATKKAVRFLENLLAGGSPYLFHHRMQAGQGLLCNNVLHNRTAFMDDVDRGITRVIYRGRYYERIAGAGVDELHDGPRTPRANAST